MADKAGAAARAGGSVSPDPTGAAALSFATWLWALGKPETSLRVGSVPWGDAAVFSYRQHRIFRQQHSYFYALKHTLSASNFS